MTSRLTTDYTEIEESQLTPPRCNKTGNVWLYDPDKDCAYLQWPDVRLSVHNTGQSAWWYPYLSSGRTRPVLLRPYPDGEKDHWIINLHDIPGA